MVDDLAGALDEIVHCPNLTPADSRRVAAALWTPRRDVMANLSDVERRRDLADSVVHCAGSYPGHQRNE
jgi:hypothetical protein